MADYHIEDIYGGGYSSLNPKIGNSYGNFTGYNKISPNTIGLAGDPRTANVLQDVSQKLQTGAKNIEVSTFQPDVFESIPNQQLEEVRRLSKITGVNVSLHGIMVEPSGIGQQGFDEMNREKIERQMVRD